MAEQDVEVDPGESGAAGVDAGTVQVLLHQDLRHEVADLGTHHGERDGRVAEFLAETSSQLEACAALAKRALDRVAEAIGGAPGRSPEAVASAVSRTEPGSGSARPRLAKALRVS